MGILDEAMGNSEDYSYENPAGPADTSNIGDTGTAKEQAGPAQGQSVLDQGQYATTGSSGATEQPSSIQTDVANSAPTDQGTSNTLGPTPAESTGTDYAAYYSNPVNASGMYRQAISTDKTFAEVAKGETNWVSKAMTNVGKALSLEGGDKSNSLVLGALFSGISGLFGSKTATQKLANETTVANASMLNATTNQQIATDTQNNKIKHQQDATAAAQAIAMQKPLTIQYGKTQSPYKVA